MADPLDVLYPPPMLPVKKVRPDAVLPKYQSAGAAGFDFHACVDGAEGLLCIPPYGRVTISSGLAFQVPKGYELQVRSRSGTAIKDGLVITNQPGTIDSDYRGEVKLAITNLDNREKWIHHGDRIAQGIVAPVVQTTIVEVEELSTTERGAGGFGSTGKQ